MAILSLTDMICSKQISQQANVLQQLCNKVISFISADSKIKTLHFHEYVHKGHISHSSYIIIDVVYI